MSLFHRPPCQPYADTPSHESEQPLRWADTRARFDPGGGEVYAWETAGAAIWEDDMSLYSLQKLLYQLNRDPDARTRFKQDPEAHARPFELTAEEMQAVLEPDIGLLYVLGVNGQIFMRYAALRGLEWSAYIEAMREGVRRHGPVRAGIYAMVED
jgi:hypothetical protein